MLQAIADAEATDIRKGESRGSDGRVTEEEV